MNPKTAVTATYTEMKHLAVFVVIMLVFLLSQNAKIGELKTEINTVVEVSCLQNQNASIFKKYDDFVDTFIDQQKTAQRLNSVKGDGVKATADSTYATRAAHDRIPIPTQKQLSAQCAKPLLK